MESILNVQMVIDLAQEFDVGHHSEDLWKMTMSGPKSKSQGINYMVFDETGA